jgi:hypothetical protein
MTQSNLSEKMEKIYSDKFKIFYGTLAQVLEHALKDNLAVLICGSAFVMAEARNALGLDFEIDLIY